MFSQHICTDSSSDVYSVLKASVLNRDSSTHLASFTVNIVKTIHILVRGKLMVAWLPL